MLIKCPECELQASDRALSCPHCGYPMQPEAAPRAPRKTNKKRRLPNGFGQISEIKNRNLRKPFRAMITVGKDDNGRPICKPLKPESFFETYNDAYAALVEYNKSPYDLGDAITVRELYEKWSTEHFKTLGSESAKYVIQSAWNYCSAVYDMRAIDIRGRHIKSCMENGVTIINGKERRPSAGLKTRIKSTFNLMLDYALEYELVERNYARELKLTNELVKEASTVKKEHMAFTDEEIELLWKNKDDNQYINIILVQSYSGWRPREVISLELENIDLENWTFTGGMKTEAGTNRTVPIHSKIRDIVSKAYKEAENVCSKHLFGRTDSNGNRINKKLTYDTYLENFYRIRDNLKMHPDHRPHDCRTHFVTTAKKYKVDEYAIKRIIGHAIKDLTERVYTKRDVEWLRGEIEKIK